MTEFIYLIIFFFLLLVIAGKDIARKKMFYAVLFIIGAAGSIPFEYPLISFGLWNHSIYPQILGVSWFAILMYVPFLSLSYFIGDFLARKLKYNKYIMFFVSGMAIGFVIDITSVALGFYRYNFTIPFAIGGVPLGITIAEGIAVSVAIAISDYISKMITKRANLKK
jgi:hypothetical protein